MRRVGIREFRDNATKLLAEGETLQIERHGHPVGYFIPVRRKDADADAALERLAEAALRAVREGDLDEDALAELFALRR